MTIEKVNKIFKKKYPNGRIIQKGKYSGHNSKVCVIFDETKTNIKPYEYNYTNYMNLLAKLGFNINYNINKKEYQKQIDKIQLELSNLPTKSKDEFESSFFCLTPLSIDNYKRELEQSLKIYNNWLNDPDTIWV